jgi:hypothetical protein
MEVFRRLIPAAGDFRWCLSDFKSPDEKCSRVDKLKKVPFKKGTFLKNNDNNNFFYFWNISNNIFLIPS